jgi:Ran GTPase-activating protein (RanGAP) involved in mRNA processing and transport
MLDISQLKSLPARCGASLDLESALSFSAQVVAAQAPKLPGASTAPQNQLCQVDMVDTMHGAPREGGTGVAATALERTLSPCAGSNNRVHNVATAVWLRTCEQALDEADDAEAVMALLTDASHNGHLSKIEHLDFASLGLRASHLERLGDLFASAHGDAVDGPITLTLNLNSVGLEGALSLASWPCMRRLRDLKLGSAELGDKGLEQLVRGSYPSLQALSLWTNSLSSASAHVLGKSQLWQSLRDLSIADNDMGDEGVSALCQYPSLTLKKLDIQWNGLSRDGARRLVANFQSTEVLIHESTIGDIS